MQKGETTMALADATKGLIVQAAQQLMRRRDFETITVEGIASACHISRNTFYYHFDDKYHMLRWMFRQQIQPVLDEGRAQGRWSDSIPALCRLMRNDPPLYTRLMRTMTADNLPGLLLDYYKQAILQGAQWYFQRRNLSDEEAEAVALYYAYGVVGSLAEWTRRGMRADPERIRHTIQGIVQEHVFRQP